MNENQWDELEQWIREEQAVRDFKQQWIETHEFIASL